MNIVRIIREWVARRDRRRMEQQAAAINRRRAVIRAQIATRRELRKEWRPLLGSLKDATTDALRVENRLRG